MNPSFEQKIDPARSETVVPEKVDFPELLGRLGPIISRISGKPNVRITTELTPADTIRISRLGQNPETDWFTRELFDPKDGKPKGWLVHIPKKIFEATEGAAKGKASHEAGHVAITRFHRFIPKEVLEELGFHQLIAAIEELPTDQVVRDRFPGAGTWVDEARHFAAIEGELKRRSKKNIGRVSRMAQFSSLIVYERYVQSFESFSPEVVDLYQKLSDEILSVEHTLPKENADDDEITEKAKERYRKVYKKIWPEVKKLVEADLEDEKIRKAIQEAKKEKEEGKKDTPLQKALEELARELREELDELLKNESREHGKEEEEEDDGSDNRDSPQRPDEPATPKNKTNQEPKESEENAPDHGHAEDEVPGEEDPLQAAMNIPIEKMSQALIRALQDAFNRLPLDLQRVLGEAARRTLEVIEDELAKEYSGAFLPAPQTHESYRQELELVLQRVRQPEEIREERQRIEEELADIAKRQAELGDNKDFYEKTYQEIRPLEERLYRELEEILRPNTKRKKRLKSSGAKINLPSVFRWEGERKGGAKKTDNKIFESVHLPEAKDYAFTILNDLSGSMVGEKIKQDFRAKVLLTEVLNRLGIKNEILGFNETIIEFKKFDQPLDDDLRKKINGMFDEVFKDKGNSDGPSLLHASRSLEMQPSKEKFLLVISDGLPTIPGGIIPEGYDGWKTARQELHQAVAHVLTKTNQKLIGIGLGSGTEHVAQFYPTALPNISAEDLAETLGGLLKDMIISPSKYTYHKSA